jgi:hypothetical protein
LGRKYDILCWFWLAHPQKEPGSGEDGLRVLAKNYRLRRITSLLKLSISTCSRSSSIFNPIKHKTPIQISDAQGILAKRIQTRK